ncbi:uncharacterized protein LOC135497809 [Lineus longissimus]|uniref:uncharacterized protein LOC135497809 n=1 Tax=Lineus longissimus TaxID=88925 RepID=UPI00315DC667
MYTRYKREMEEEIDLVDAVHKVLQKELDERESFLTKEDIMKLLVNDNAEARPFREGCKGYPAHPLYKEIGSVLQKWLDTGHCIVLDLPTYELFDEQGYEQVRQEYTKSIEGMMVGFKSLWSVWSPDERFYRVREILQRLGKRGLMDMLGIRKTVGTCEMFPPPRYTLEETFNEKHSANSELTVGARALAKHGHRDQTASWWGKSTGTEEAKNAHAVKVIDRILNEATWINIHQLQHQVEILEIRQIDGYGARWSADGATFRGFLEPQMTEGWTCGYRH